jgi:hypothetical protein
MDRLSPHQSGIFFVGPFYRHLQQPIENEWLAMQNGTD